jgi:hypothetical protein
MAPTNGKVANLAATRPARRFGPATIATDVDNPTRRFRRATAQSRPFTRFACARF